MKWMNDKIYHGCRVRAKRLMYLPDIGVVAFRKGDEFTLSMIFERVDMTGLYTIANRRFDLTGALEVLPDETPEQKELREIEQQLGDIKDRLATLREGME